MAIRDRVKELRRLPASSLLPSPKNWRRHPPAQQNALRGVLAEIGFADTLLARETPEGLMLVDGHLRQEVMGDALVPVLVLDVTEAEADALLATLDPLAAMASHDQEALLSLLESVKFQSPAVNDLLEALANDNYQSLTPLPPLHKPQPDPGPQLDRAAELQQKWGTARSQLWEVGKHRLMCGDATEDQEVHQLMDGRRALCMWTDPPYGVGIVGGFRRLSEDARKRVRPSSSVIMGDTPSEVPVLLDKVFSLIQEVMEPGSPWYCARPAGEHSFLFADALRNLGWHLHQELQWVKGTMVLGHSDYHLRHETIMYGWLPGPGRPGRGAHAGSRWFGDNSQTSVMEIPLAHSPNHPATKPVALVAAHLANSSPHGGVVVDPFLGSGTTMVASEQLGRICYGMEIEPKYVAVALERTAGMGLEPKVTNG